MRAAPGTGPNESDPLMTSPQPVGEDLARDGELSATEQAVVAALAAYLAAKTTEAATAPAAGTARAAVTAAQALVIAAGIGGVLLAALLRLGLDRRALRAVVTVTVTVTGREGTGTSLLGAAARRTAREEMAFRAAYIVAATRRVTDALRAPTPIRPDQDTQQRPDVAERLREALARERRFLDQHLAATDNRARAARAADRAARGGLRLRWRTQRDDRVDADCARLDGRVFTIGNPPGGKYPGAEHPRCRCFAEPV